MACCFSLFYDASGLTWGAELIASAIINSAKASQQQPGVNTDRPLSTEDCRVEVVLDDKLTPASGSQFRITDYSPRAFRYFREDPRFGNNISGEDWIKEWEETKSKPQSGALGSGKSGATFIPSANSYYLIKNIDKKEVGVQIDTLKQYLVHFERFPNSLIMRHLNLLKIEEVNQNGSVVLTKYILVSENINDVPSKLKIPIECWDLKGRIPKPGKLPHPSRTVGGTKKDKDLLRDFRVSSSMHKGLIDQLEKDTEYLKSHNLMDYSLLLCIVKTNLSLEQRKKLVSSTDENLGLTREALDTFLKSGSIAMRENVQRYHNGVVSSDGTEVFFMGVIDALTNYHGAKKLANCCKQFAFFESQLSTIPAEPYGDRFFKFMTFIFRHKPRKTTIVGAPNQVCPLEFKASKHTLECPLMG